MKKRITFISHEASLSGAPVLLANLVRLVQQDGRYQANIIIKRGGPLTDTFRILAPTLVIKPFHYWQNTSLVKKALQLVAARWQLLRACWWAWRSQLVFSNTITNGLLMKKMAWGRFCFITYVHELNDVAKLFEQTGDTQASLHLSRLLLVPTEKVRQCLQNVYRVSPSQIRNLPYYFPFPPITFDPTTKAERRRIFGSQYGINPHTFWVVGMGMVNMRKGYDLFMETARICHKKNPSVISFVWIGPPENEGLAKELAQLKDTHAGYNLHFIGALPHDYHKLLPFDVMFLSSREDPYPLVVLEAAYCGIPAICFGGTSGIEAFIADDAGWIVDAFDTTKVAALLQQLLLAPFAIAQKATNAHYKAMQLHGNAPLVLQQFYSACNEALGQTDNGENA
jgi:glycosyltransferase involved in cell wall biosynthesis